MFIAHHRLRLLLLTLCLPLASWAGEYNDTVRRILSHKCFKCHGPDEPERKAKLRLDQSAKQDWQEVIARITSSDPDERMPPPEANKTLSEEEIAAIKRWIGNGAAYEAHWAFEAPRIADPGLKKSEAIDHYIDAGLNGLKPNPPADPHTLLRRLYLDLIGLPPSVEETQAFVRDPSPEAWEKLVERLLDSPQYGERWARRWLDLARYADTNGYEKDRPRSIWPYRDWVIRAINADLPFDRFTIEQLAGDMLPNPTRDQRIATGFHRNTMLNEEGGIDPLEFRFHAMADRVGTTGTTWLGLTTACAQCHTHKFDPITHHEYYGMMAFLNNADEPELDLPSNDQEAQLRKNRAEADRLLAELPKHWPETEATLELRFKEWIEETRAASIRWTPVTPVAMKTNLPHLALQEDGSIFASGDSTKHDTYELTFRPGGKKITALRLEALPDARLPARGPGSTYYEGRKGEFFLGEFQLEAGGKKIPLSGATETYAKNQFGKNPVSAVLATDGDLQTGWSAAGRYGERHVAVFPLETPLEGAREINVTMHFGRHFASSLGRFRISVTGEDKNAEASDLPFETGQLLHWAPQNDVERKALFQAFLMQAPELKQQAKRIRELRKRPSYTTTLVMLERPKDNPRPTHLHHRGEFTHPKEQVPAVVPAVLHAYPEGIPRDRLGFAKWLVARENPLTARVIVNRHWAAFFGQGLVRSLDDFGMQGERPSHPALLDWLAVGFMDEGWSVKKLHKRIVMSEAYRRSSNVTPAQLVRDPENRLLARAPRFRLEAEILRDSVLAASGLLSDKMFGPPVRPPQPPGITELAYGKPKWNPSGGEDRYRRSVYTHIKRTAPFAMFTTFDGSSGEACVARRERSNSALQALTLLNDVMFLEAAQALGKELAGFSGDDAAKIEQAFLRVLSRPPAKDETALFTAFVEKQRARKLPPKLAGKKGTSEQAVWTSLARALFNLDETVTRN